MDSAKLYQYLLKNKKLHKSKEVTFRKVLLKMNALPLQENLKKFTHTESCPIRNVIARFSSKWSVLVLCVLAENDKTRFNSISKAIPDISPKVLSETLKNLEADGLIERKIYAEIPPKVEYSLTDLANGLMPKLYGLIEWALENYSNFQH